MKLEWLNEELTRAKVTVESKASRWWRRRFITAEVERVPLRSSLVRYAEWRFVVGGDRVCDHDDALAQQIERTAQSEQSERAKRGERAKLKNPWTAVEPLPPARTVKR